MLQVVAAIIERESSILICRRRRDQSHALKWEFPGGKVETGETPQQALTRELTEELGVIDAAGEEITRYEYTYPGKRPMELIFFRVTAYRGQARNRIFEDMRWVAREQLGRFDFVEGDRNFIQWFGA